MSGPPSSANAGAAPADPVDLLVIGGGINGCGIARDAAGRGLSVMLVEQDDLASATSQWSSKLIHGGLRYLEHYEFRLVAESLAEREVLLRMAPHLIGPLEFVIPHEPHQRPRWMIRAGLYVYDFLGGKKTLPASQSLVLPGSPKSAGLRAAYTNGFSYFDARADDARLTILNARGAADLGAVIAPFTRFVSAEVQQGVWQVTLQDALTQRHTVQRARALVNAAGPWVMRVQGGIKGLPASRERVKHVKGSHIVVPRVHDQEHAYLLQNRDGRIVFVMPFHSQFTLIGTTDIPVEAWDAPAISESETQYLCQIASQYLARPITPQDVLWSYSGVRPLYDDGQANASAITRDYVLKIEAAAGAPLLNVFGGKLTTYRKLAEHALAKLAAHCAAAGCAPMGPAWTDRVPLPGGDFAGGLGALEAELHRAYPFVPLAHVRGIARRHGTLAGQWLGGARHIEELGEHFGAGLYAAEVDHMMAREWAHNARVGRNGKTGKAGREGGECVLTPEQLRKATQGILMRRSKCGLFMNPQQTARVADYLNLQ